MKTTLNSSNKSKDQLYMNEVKKTSMSNKIAALLMLMSILIGPVLVVAIKMI